MRCRTLIQLCVGVLIYFGMPQFVLSNTLYEQGTTSYDIVLPKRASTSERTAAKELRAYLLQMCGVDFSATSSQSSHEHHIYVGYNSSADAFRGLTRYVDAYEGFTYLSVGDDIVIYGGRNRGTMYGVYAFLSDKLGVQWYSPEYTYVPQAHSLALEFPFETHQTPGIAHRFVYTYDAIHNDVWCAHNLLNNQTTPINNKYGGMHSYWGAHTFQKLLPPDEYFDAHPEYFSLRDGKRVRDAQLCLSNPQVLQLVTERLLRYMAASPNYWGYDVSQNDNQLYCTCAGCSRLSAKYGGQSGLMLWFVNQVARTVKHTYPDKYIGTFAYEYTRKAPTGIHPESNVLIRLCDIECCLIHPLESCPENRSFVEDIQEWQKLTQHIYVWDYIVNFHFYHLPYPNFHAIGQNIDFFRRHGVTGILELGAYDAQWSEFSELKQWLTAKLLWNPQQNVDSLAHKFIADYYGAASEDIWTYYTLVDSVAQSMHYHSDCHAEPSKELYSPALRERSLALLNHAEQEVAVTSDAVLIKRVRRVLAQALCMRTLLDFRQSAMDGTPVRLKKIIDADNTKMRERGQNINQYLRLHGYI